MLSLSSRKINKYPIIFDFIAIILIFDLMSLIALGVHQLSAKIEVYQHYTISLSPSYLPFYAFMTTLRIFIAVIISLIFTLIVATIAAKNAKAEAIIIPLLDILQSVPVLGYISFTITGFVALFPNKVLGIEMATIFAIFTAQVWNMTFSFYQSLKTTPKDLHEASAMLGLSSWQKFWKVELPFAIPGLIWNTMMSVSASWFFVVASEAVSVGNIKFVLPGIGSYITTAMDQKNLIAIGYVIFTMFCVILIYDQLLFRPIVSWSDKFRYELASGQVNNKSSWLIKLLKKSHFLKYICNAVFAKTKRIIKKLTGFNLFNNIPYKRNIQPIQLSKPIENFIWYVFLIIFTILAGIKIIVIINKYITFQEVMHVVFLGFITAIRIFILIIFASIIWVPIGVYIGLKPKLTEKVQPIIQFLAAFPANLFFPIAVILIVNNHLNPNIWLSPLIILGTQWYILFNVIVGAASIPNDLKEAALTFHIKGINWWRKVIIPGIYPYLITGMVTASGGAWNASIVSEAVNWGSTNLYATGIGAYITQKTVAGDFSHIALGICVMCFYVLLFNKILWRPLYNKAEKQIHLD